MEILIFFLFCNLKIIRMYFNSIIHFSFGVLLCDRKFNSYIDYRRKHFYLRILRSVSVSVSINSKFSTPRFRIHLIWKLMMCILNGTNGMFEIPFVVFEIFRLFCPWVYVFFKTVLSLLYTWGTPQGKSRMCIDAIIYQIFGLDSIEEQENLPLCLNTTL